MENIIFRLDSNILLIGACAGLIILLLWNIIMSVKLGKLKKKYGKLMGGSSASAIEDIIIENVGKADEAAARVIKLEREFEELKLQLEGCVQRVDIIRYNAFSDTGSDLSYSLALLNNKNDGLLLTGIYGRNESYTYAKPINAGESTYTLSAEEIQVLNKVKK